MTADVAGSIKQVQVVTDSASDIPPELSEKYGVVVIPVYVRFGDDVYRDGVEMSRQSFTQRLLSTIMPPKTSGPSPFDFVETYRSISDRLSIVSVHISSKLSGTFQSAVLARSMLPERDITILDSHSGSMGLGLSVIEAARAALSGLSRDRVVKRAGEVIDRAKVFLTLETLEWVYRNGRIGRAASLLGNLLSLKPILTVDDGVLAAFDRVRGSSKVIPRLVEICRERVIDPARVRCVVAHTAFRDQADKLKSELERILGLTDVIICEAGPAIMANVGPGALGIMFFEDKEDPDVADNMPPVVGDTR
jgi:DegV family protein with EDD domain